MTIDLLIKIGGSCISDKEQIFKALKSNSLDAAKLLKLKTIMINQIAEGLGVVYKSMKRIIILTGVGTPGHYTVLKYQLHKGNNKTLKQHLGLLEAQIAVNRLRQEFLEAFLRHKLPVVQFYASSMYESNNRRIIKGNTDNIAKFMSTGMVPVISGDMVPDITMGYSVLSGDQILYDLAKKFKPEKIIFGSDVDGIYESDPKKNPNSRLITQISRNEIDSRIEEIGGTDASGQLRGKLNEIKNLLDNDFGDIAVINLTKKGILKQVLLEEEVLCTHFYK
ncbi:MAG: isopentenyl phosphate kinase [Candidatus Hodarchaeota archaeon]